MVKERGVARRDDAAACLREPPDSFDHLASFSKRTDRRRASIPNLVQPYTHTLPFAVYPLRLRRW
jgi:hypothetical protein